LIVVFFPSQKLRELPQIIADINGNDISRQIEATSKVRKLLSIGTFPLSFYQLLKHYFFMMLQV
jgi:hypothetical protein